MHQYLIATLRQDFPSEMTIKGNIPWNTAMSRQQDSRTTRIPGKHFGPCDQPSANSLSGHVGRDRNILEIKVPLVACRNQNSGDPTAGLSERYLSGFDIPVETFGYVWHVREFSDPGRIGRLDDPQGGFFVFGLCRAEDYIAHLEIMPPGVRKEHACR